jgi:hypothetical protein
VQTPLLLLLVLPRVPRLCRLPPSVLPLHVLLLLPQSSLQ